MKTILRIITPVVLDTQIARPNIGQYPIDKTRVYDCRIPMSFDSAYDKGGAYWGSGGAIRVRYTKDLSYVEFYREGNSCPIRMEVASQLTQS